MRFFSIKILLSFVSSLLSDGASKLTAHCPSKVEGRRTKGVFLFFCLMSKVKRQKLFLYFFVESLKCSFCFES